MQVSTHSQPRHYDLYTAIDVSSSEQLDRPGAQTLPQIVRSALRAHTAGLDALWWDIDHRLVINRERVVILCPVPAEHHPFSSTFPMFVSNQFIVLLYKNGSKKAFHSPPINELMPDSHASIEARDLALRKTRLSFLHRLFLYLSRACLGKIVVFIINCSKEAFGAPLQAPGVRRGPRWH